MVHTLRHQAESLLNALDPLPYPLRMRELAARTRELEETRPLLDELESRGAYERGLAVVAASVAGDTEWIAARIADPDSFVRGHALRTADSLQVPDSAYESALIDAPEGIRRQLLRAVVAGRRTALADRLVDGVRAEWGDEEAARLLPGCSPETVARLLPALLHAVQGSKSLGRRHPGALLDVAERELRALPESLRDAWWQRYTQAVVVTVTAEPLRVLELIERLGPSRIPAQLLDQVGAFAGVAPERVLRLLISDRFPSYIGARSRSLQRRLARSAAEELAVYGRMLAASGGLAPLLQALPPARRHAFYTASTAGRGVGGTTVDAVILEALPRSCVAEEARRMAAAARERGETWDTVLLAESFLPVDEVRERLVEATRRPAAEDRALAWPLLIRNAARSGDSAAVTSVLEESARLRNEQDPVRLPALNAMSRTPPALFTEDAEPHLDRITADAVEARDSSHQTRGNLSELALSVLREHAAGGSRELVNWALRTLVRISGNTGRADLGRLDAKLRRGQEHQVYEALRPWIEAGAEKSDYSLAFSLARAVGRRAAGMPELQELLGQAVRFGSDSTVRDAVELWLEPPATRDERVARILSLEPSAGTLWPVLDVITRRRTDLLDVLLADTPPYGRFLTKGSPWTVPVGHDVRRWLPRQQEAVARQLADQAADAGLPSYTRVAAIAQGARIPGAGIGLVRDWTGSSDVVLAEAALGALAHTDRPGDALPELLAHAGNDRARVAVYAATRASRHVPPSRLVEQLREVLLGPGIKVTSRKEAARLAAARLPLPVAAGLLAEAYERPGAHLDVRAACVAFAGALLTEESVWTLLGDASDAEPVLRAAVLRVSPLDLPERHRARYARLVRDVCATDDPATAPLAFAALSHWAPWSPDAPTVLASATADLSNRTSWRAAGQGLVVAAAGAAGGAEGLREALRVLAEAEAESEPEPETEASANAFAADAEPRRDRPARQRVDYLVARLAQQARTAAGPVREAALGAGELLASYDGFVPQAATIAAFHLDLDAEAEQVDTALDRLAALTAGRPVLAARTATELAARLRRTQEGDAETLLGAARRLTVHGGHSEGLLATAITATIGTRTGWAPAWRAQLRTLRRHPHPDVRDAALAQMTAYE
ncbi:hypothetical protein FHS35_005201 [Streptomyces umbrinus]|uniref:hypothetical protein n=1 Tax=Streptomyces umbrinus TaxID=67370 RepID=UPI00167D6F62|nr:hypothetical protein [Streptomyces umbrinus]MCR3728326.1 hypothetical protein [Streptomyces umbrinus]GHH35488.1 hypothetical protein GCM10018775_09990 [Streptomyces umbrinus]